MNNKKKIKVSLIILTFNGIDLTLDVLKDISKLDISGITTETVVVDNASKDETVKTLKNYKLPNMDFKLIVNDENLGFAGGNNVGIKDCLKRGSDFIVLLNNDVILSKNLLQVLVNTALKNEKIGIVSPKMYFAKGFEFHKDRYKESELGKVIWYAGGIIDKNNVYSHHKGVDEVDLGQYDNEEETDFANAAAVLIRSKLFEEIGLLDEKFFLYWEDADLSQRAKLKNWKVVYTPKTHIWHKVSVATGGPGGEVNDYYLIRNRFVFGFRYFSLRTKLALIRDSFRILLKGRKWQKMAVVDFYLGRLGKGSKIK